MVRAGTTRRDGFTLIELLLALTIFSLVAAMAGGVFWSITKAWNRGGEMLEQLHYGEFAMEQLVTALRGAAWFPSRPQAFGFWLDDRGGTSRSAANKISWVTSGTSFLPPDSPFQHGLHRISVTVEGSGENRGLTVRAWPHLAEEIDERSVDSWLVAPGVEGFACEWYDFDEKRWTQNWEETNSLPKLVRVTLTMQKRKDFDEYLELQRLVELEVAPEIPGRERRDRSGAPQRTTPPQEAQVAEQRPSESQAPSAGDGRPSPGRPTIGRPTITQPPGMPGQPGGPRP